MEQKTTRGGGKKCAEHIYNTEHKQDALSELTLAVKAGERLKSMQNMYTVVAPFYPGGIIYRKPQDGGGCKCVTCHGLAKSQTLLNGE